MKNVSDKKIFISYRVQDTAGETGRLVDALKQNFADDQLFMDIENLEPGADFTEAIGRSLSGCDVFLAVIGPRWIGPRQGQPPRIMEANDWVRLEVATALQRGVRVVPLLVDGATLPTSDNLPDDLQPLLKRQTLEISNKRWRYDTDQLIQFLVNTAGIAPRRHLMAARTSAAPQAKSRTWLYVSIGFVLAISLMVALATMAPNEGSETALPKPTTNTQTQQNAVPANTLSATENADVAGTWQEVDEGITTTLYLTQNGNAVSVRAQVGEEVIGNGNGMISGRTVDLTVPLFGVATSLRGTLSADGATINGSYSVPATGDVKPFLLRRQ